MKSSKMKIIILSALIFLLVSFGVFSAAYYTDEDALLNSARNSHSDIVIKEEFDPPTGPMIPAMSDVYKEVKIQNKGAECFVRVYLEFSDSGYEDKTSIDFNTSDWEKIGDYWYYKKVLQRGETTPELMSNIHFFTNVPNDFEIIVYAESVHVKEATDYKTAFDKLNETKVG